MSFKTIRSTVSKQQNELHQSIQKSSKISINPKKSQKSYTPNVIQNADAASVSTLSIQNLEFPCDFSRKPVIRVGQANLLNISKMPTTPTTTKTRAWDFSSTTNSHFDGLVFSAPKKIKGKCKLSDVEISSESSEYSVIKPKKVIDEITSQEMIDIHHTDSPRILRLKGPEWRKPCKESFVAGAPRAYIGTCPPNMEKLAKLSKPRQKFFLTQDPRKKYCLRNPALLRNKAYSKKKELNVLSKMVKHADNVYEETASETSESFICDVIDAENPMQLDFQGLDYKNTYEHDEQDIQNQRIYRRICRFMDRQRVKSQTEEVVEKELQADRLAIPDCFNVVDRNEIIKSPTPVESIRHGKLYRSTEKPAVKVRLQEEHDKRKQRYKDLYLRRKEKDEIEQKHREKIEKDEKEYKASTIAVKHFEEAVNNINNVIETSNKVDTKDIKKTDERRRFPHTIRETIKFKKQLKDANRIKRDEAIIKKAFFETNFGKVKGYPEADLDISSESTKFSMGSKEHSEESSDNEDEMEVGKKGDVFKLRGFHFKMGNNLRGKRSDRQGMQGAHKEKGCKTRDQWLMELAPKRERIKMDVEEGIQKIKNPDDPDSKLFYPEFGFEPPVAKTSAVRQFVEKRLGRHYDRTLRKNLKLVKPRLKYSVKKFNLISFLYGESDQKLKEMKKDIKKQIKTVKHETTLDYIEAKQKLKKIQNDLLRQKRLKLLGIPWHEVKKSRLQTRCENSETETDSDWVPEREEAGKTDSQQPIVTLSLRQRGNMPAPKHRETTLRRHPRNPRDYELERVPTALFDETVEKTGIPHMHSMNPDKYKYSNLKMRKRPYAQIFNARHHHDHWNPTQNNVVNVHYQSDVVQPLPTKIKAKIDKIVMENFKMADPPCNKYVNMDLTLPRYDIDGIIKEHINKKKQKHLKITETTKKALCIPRDTIFHSRPPEELQKLDYPGRQEYLDLLNEVKASFNKYETNENEDGTNFAVDKDELIRELEDDLKSIETCLSSLSSSQCTNLTNDSGSYLLMEGITKVPLDYIRKSIIPFEELNRSRFCVEPIDVDAEDANPFKVLPFSGQKKAQLELTTPQDSFFTFNTRLQNGLRLRLEVPVEDVRHKLMGIGKKKYPGLVTTDIDENYVDELKNRPPIKMFKFKTGASYIKDALRLKFESMLIQGQIVRTKIYDRLNEQHWDYMQKTKFLYDRLFAKWEKQEYEAAMSVVHKVKNYYEKTDELKREFRELEREQLILNMDIVFIEGHWIRRIMLQNFHYLLADQDWRQENDWIHRIEDSDELESFEESIAKRNIVNIRQREKDDAWAIKTFYEEVYLKNQHPILIVFPDAESFIQGIENLKMKTFVLLLELHYTLSIHTELQGRLESFEEWCAKDLKDKEEYVSRKCAKLYFMSDRANELKRRTLTFLDQPIEQAFNDEGFNRDRAVIAEVWRRIVPANVRGSNDQEIDPIDMVAMMSDVILELISKFENIPTEKCRRVESSLRRRQAYERKLSYQAYQVEKRIESEMKKVRKNLEPPYQKPKREGKLPRLFIKKKKQVIEVQQKRVSEHTRLFFRAFHDSEDLTQLGEIQDSLLVVDHIQEQIVPFYFDHFLKINGYTPNYNFKTHVELRDGNEYERLKVQSLVPEIQEKMGRWEIHKRRIMEDNISRNPKMYENVNF